MPKQGGNAGGNKNGPREVPTIEINKAMVPGSIALIDATKGNGSFENLNSGGQPITGSNGSKQTFPGWSATFKGVKAGLSSQDTRGSSDGKFYGFAQKKSSLDLTSNPVDYLTQEGDVFRVAADIASVHGEANWKGKTKYSFILGFRGKQGATSKWKLAEVEDQTDVTKRKRTIGYQYTAQSADVGKKPFVKVVMNEHMGRRPINYLDNVRLSVQNPKNSLASDSGSPSVATTAEPAMADPPEDPPPATKMAETPMVAATSDVPAGDPDTSVDPNTTYSAPMRKVYLRTSDGRGADAAVKKGGSSRDTLGQKPSIAVQQRGDVPIQHTYLKFDLESITPAKEGNNKNKEVRRKTGRVALMLKSTGKKEPAGGQLMVYGASDEAAQIWAESGPRAIHWKVSYSEGGLGSLPLLAELTIPEGQAAGSTITITSQELAEFVRNSPGSLTTLVLAGRSNNNMPLSFVSNNGSKENAPSLIVEVAP